MTQYLLATEAGVRVVQASTAAELAQIVAATVVASRTLPGAPPNTTASGAASVVELTSAADVVSGAVPQSFIDSQANRATIVGKAQTALGANATFLALSPPTNAQVVAQVQALTRQMNALIKLTLSQLNDTTGT